MPFEPENQITEVETRAGRFATQGLMRRFVNRDEELLGRIEQGGPPTSVPAISAIQRQGDLVYTTNTTVGGIVYCDSFTVNPGVVVTVDRFLIVKAKNEIIVHGHINADGQGRIGGLRGLPGEPGATGITPGGGGGVCDTTGFGDPDPNGGPGGGGVFDLQGGAPGDLGVWDGQPGEAHNALSTAIIFADIYNYLIGGSGGGGGGDSGGDGKGGNGGGVIVLDAPAITLSANAMITARGQNGHYGGTSTGGGGGGGGGALKLRTRSYNASDNALLAVEGGQGGSTGGNNPRGSGGAGVDGVIQVEVFG